MLHNPEASLLKFENIVNKLFSHKRMSSSETDRAKQQCESFLNGTVLKNKEKFEGFNSSNSHIDTFLAEFHARNEEFKWFGLFVKLFSFSRMDRARLRGVLMLITRSWLKILRRSLSNAVYYIWSHSVWKHKTPRFQTY